MTPSQGSRATSRVCSVNHVQVFHDHNMWKLLKFRKLVPRVGLEPTSCCQRGILSPLCLPIPPPRQEVAQYSGMIGGGKCLC